MLRTIWNTLSTFMIIALTISFVKWYVKGHFGKYFIFFWLYTISVIVIYVNHKNNLPDPDTRTGAEVWEEMHGRQ
ncbi:MAG: hypothetical protein ACK47F_03565 [Flavobacteriales bacterium]